MATSADYPPGLRRDDERRGRRDGEKRIPSLTEVRRRQEEIQQAGGQLTVGYQVVLLAEFTGHLNALFPRFQSTGRSAAQELREIDDRLTDAEGGVVRAQDSAAEAAAALTPDELLPRNYEEQNWDPAMLRSRRVVERSRRMKRATEILDTARGRVRQLRTDQLAAGRRRDEALAAFGLEARHLQDLYQRRIAAYLDALTQAHPDGKTLYPLLAMPEVPLPEWAVEALVPKPDNDPRSTT